MLCDLILMAMYLMTNDFLERRQVAATEIRKEEERIETIARMEDPSRQFQEMQRTGLQATRKPMALSILAKGLDEKLPVTVTTARPPGYADNPPKGSMPFTVQDRNPVPVYQVQGFELGQRHPPNHPQPGRWQSPAMPGHYARGQLAARGAVARVRYGRG